MRYRSLSVGEPYHSSELSPFHCGLAPLTRFVTEPYTS